MGEQKGFSFSAIKHVPKIKKEEGRILNEVGCFHNEFKECKD